MNSIQNTVLLAAIFLVLFGLAEFLYHRYNCKVEYTRKLVHTGSGILSISFPLLISNNWLILLLCSAFMGILILSKRYGFLPSINAVDRKTYGSILFPVIVYTAYLAFEYSGSLLLYYLPLCILAISDPLAALAGKSWPFGKYTINGHPKTLMGSSAFFISAFLLSYSSLVWLEGVSHKEAWILGFLLAITTTLTEAIMYRGYDNLFIPLTAILVLFIIQ